LVSPETVIGLVAEVPVRDPGDDKALYVVPGIPPAVNATVAEASPAVAVPMVGVLGIEVFPARIESYFNTPVLIPEFFIRVTAIGYPNCS
jgi:hypothetical protein